MNFKKFLEEGCITGNCKTGQSVDFTTNCPKRREEKACEYCYVEAARKKGYNAKKLIEYSPYKGEVKRFKAEKIRTLNAVGGIRLFSFGDYMPEHDKDVQKFLDDCQEVGLKVKAITKQPAFVHKYANHPAMNVINVSIDAIGHGVDHKEALELKKKYPNVRIRSVITKPQDLDHEIMKDVDVYTLNHANGFKKYGYRHFSKEEKKELDKALGGKVCCTEGKCSSCKLKCGAGDTKRTENKEEKDSVVSRILNKMGVKKEK